MLFLPPGGRIGTYNCTLGVAPCVEKRNFLKVTVKSLKQVFAPVTSPSFFNFLAASSSETCMLRTPRLLAFVVKESEFRLNDQLHNMGEVVGAPKLVLNNLVPENDSRIMAKQLVGSLSRNTTGLHCWLLLVMPYRSSQSPTGLRMKGKSIPWGSQKRSWRSTWLRSTCGSWSAMPWSRTREPRTTT